LLPTFAFIGFQENIQQFIPKIKRNLSAKGLVTPLEISFSDDVQNIVKHKLHFDELK
jgi:hypothetical protein